MSTIREIAGRANVSIGTVDRVIHNRGRVAKETEDKIREIIAELDFKPNIFARNLKLSKTFHFGVLSPIPTQDSKYWEIPVRGINKALDELRSHNIKADFFYYDKYSEASINSVTAQIANQELDGLLIAPVLSNVFESCIQRIPINLPYVFFDSFIPGTRCISYIGQDSFQSGVLAGKLMHLLTKEKGTVAVVKFIPEDYVIEERARGFQDYIAKNCGCPLKIYYIDETKGEDNFDTVARKMLEETTDLQGVLVTYAATHRFGRFFKEQGKKIGVIGYDPVDENIRALKTGDVDFLISQMPEKQGYDGIYTLYRHIVLKHSVKEKTLMPMHIVTKENVDYYFGSYTDPEKE